MPTATKANGSAPAPTVAIDLQRLTRSQMELTLVGDTPLACHRFSEKARQMMADRQQQKAKAKKPPKDPEADFNAARYLTPDGRDAIPAEMLKAALVDAARHFDGVTFVDLKQSLFVEAGGPDDGGLIPLILESPPENWEQPVRIAMGTSDIRYRPRYFPWSVKVVVTFMSHMVTANSVVALADAAGLGGIGEWRPSAPKSKTGNYGRFHVADSTEVGE